MLPKLTPLQYLVLNLLFVGRQSGDRLRRALRALGVRQSRAAFSRLMFRLMEANYVNPEQAVRSDNDQTVHYRCYEITDLGVFDWMAAQKFYLNLPPPSADLVPHVTSSGELAVYDPEIREAVSRRELDASVWRLASAFLGVDLKRPRKKARL
jgi:hypothetical protein